MKNKDRWKMIVLLLAIFLAIVAFIFLYNLATMFSRILLSILLMIFCLGVQFL